MDTPDILVWISEKTLTDGSSVFDVDFCGQIFECVTEDDAEQMAEAIVDSINNHTNQTAGVMR